MTTSQGHRTGSTNRTKPRPDIETTVLRISSLSSETENFNNSWALDFRETTFQKRAQRLEAMYGKIELTLFTNTIESKMQYKLATFDDIPFQMSRCTFGTKQYMAKVELEENKRKREIGKLRTNEKP